MLKGEKVILRALEREDVPNCHRWINDWEVKRLIAQIYPWSMRAEEQWFEQIDRDRGEVRFAIATHEGRHIGTVALANIAQEDRCASLGIMIGEKDCWSQGYGTDAIRTLLRFGFETMNLNRVQLTVVEYNHRAVRCYEKCGFVREGTRREHVYREGRYWDQHLMGILRREFEEG